MARCLRRFRLHHRIINQSKAWSSHSFIHTNSIEKKHASNSEISVFPSKSKTLLTIPSASRMQELYQSVRFAGHSHWHNIKHAKAASDAIKSKASMLVGMKIRESLKRNGSPDPKLNRHLERAFLEGRDNNVPMATMLNVVKSFTQGSEKGADLLIEAKGYGGCYFMIVCFTDSAKKTRLMVHTILKKYGGETIAIGQAGYFFDHKGAVYVDPHPQKLPNLEQATAMAIEVGAEDVIEALNIKNEEKVKFICDWKDMHDVKKALEDQGLTANDAQLEYLPKDCVVMPEMDLERAGKLLNALLQVDAVVRVFDNIASDDSS